jgi:hypothetical protein
LFCNQVYLEGGYHFGWKHKIEDYTIQIGGEDIETGRMDAEPLYVNYQHGITIKIGFGI